MWINLLSILLLWKLNPKTRFFFQRLPLPAQGGKSIWAPTVAEHLWGAKQLQQAASSEGGRAEAYALAISTGNGERVGYPGEEPFAQLLIS